MVHGRFAIRPGSTLRRRASVGHGFVPEGWEAWFDGEGIPDGTLFLFAPNGSYDGEAIR